jgi:predicted transcriptional regulator
MPSMDFSLPDGLPPWLAAFVREALLETDTLRENGAEQAATARLALLKKLAAAASTWLDAEIDTAEAAREKGVCEETIRRAVREGHIPDRRANPKGRHRVRRGDLDRVADSPNRPYDPDADAQSIAQLRRKL